MIDIDIQFERELHEKLAILRTITKAGTIEMLYRVAKADTMISKFSRKYDMHTMVAQEASEMLVGCGYIRIVREGRKKILQITEKGKKAIKILNQLVNETKK